MKAVFTLLSGKTLDEKGFCRYLHKKIGKTAGKFNVKFDFRKENKIYCLDDAAIDIIHSLMTGAKPKIKKNAFLFCLRKELELFSKLKGIKFKFIEHNGLKLKVREMLNKLESKHPEIKYSILNAQLGFSMS